jgi:hypothetical protein
MMPQMVLAEAEAEAGVLRLAMLKPVVVEAVLAYVVKAPVD